MITINRLFCFSCESVQELYDHKVFDQCPNCGKAQLKLVTIEDAEVEADDK